MSTVTEKAKHTPGPWFSPNSWRGPQPIYYKPKVGMRHRICTIDSQETSPENDSANAKLIAAAPELLAELEHTARNLQSLVNFFPADRSHAADIEYQSLKTWLERTQEAVRKAT